MTFTKVILALACLMSGTLVAQEAKVTPLLAKDLTNLPGEEGLMITVEYPPGSSDPIHRHNAHGFIYVLEGSIVTGRHQEALDDWTVDRIVGDRPLCLHTFVVHPARTGHDHKL